MRHGTTSLFAALDAKTDEVLASCKLRHRSIEFRKFLDRIEANVPADLDNASTHKTALIQRWLAKRPRFHLHFTPTSASWLNQVERWFAALAEKQLRRGVHRSTREPRRPSTPRLDSSNKNPKPLAVSLTISPLLRCSTT